MCTLSILDSRINYRSQIVVQQYKYTTVQAQVTNLFIIIICSLLQLIVLNRTKHLIIIIFFLVIYLFKQI